MSVATCSFDVSIMVGSTVTPDIFSSNIAYFVGPKVAGVYNIFYVKGALKYNPMQGWALNARAINVNSGYNVVFDSGLSSVNFPGTQDANFPSQAAVEANNKGQFVQVVHNGGLIGVYLSDDIYNDNVAGDPNPTFGLTKVG